MQDERGPRRTLLSWSSGKDSAWALARLRDDSDVELVGLLTTLNGDNDRVAMHGVRRELLELQAEAVGLPCRRIPLPFPCPNEEYERLMGEAVAQARSEGVRAVAFGDLFLEDVRAYRERMLDGSGLEPLFPIWGRPTDELSREMVEAGQRAVITCVDSKQLDPAFLGRVYDHALLDELPAGVDPCAERGEFHTFATDGPAFRHPVRVGTGERVERDGFWFVDLLPERG